MKKSLFIALGLLSSQFLSAHDFALALSDGQNLYFNVLDTVKCEVELTYEGSINDNHRSFSGNLNVPQKVKYKNKVYQVVSVGMKAFANHDRLTSVTLPSGLSAINDFAFEGCTALERVLMPGNKVRFGSGTFYRCSNISQLTIGSDWTEFDAKVFRWSPKISEVNLPARIQAVRNLKSMQGLERITVDANNSKYMDKNGVLYTKDGSTLLACPRAFKGQLDVPEGTTAIRLGAIATCTEITEVILSATLKSLSFMEFSGMRKLQRIIMKNETPIETAQIAGKRVFLLTVGNPDTYLVVGKKALKAYTKANATEAGEYSELSENVPAGQDAAKVQIPHDVRSNEMLPSEYIVGAKDFKKLDNVKPKKKRK